MTLFTCRLVGVNSTSQQSLSWQFAVNHTLNGIVLLVVILVIIGPIIDAILLTRCMIVLLVYSWDIMIVHDTIYTKFTRMC